MRKFLLIFLILLGFTSCSIDWNGEKDKRITELESENLKLKTQIENTNIEQQKLELEKERLNFDKESKEQENYRLAKNKCEKIQNENNKKLEDILNNCTTHNSLDDCMNNQAIQTMMRYTSDDELKRCIENNK